MRNQSIACCLLLVLNGHGQMDPSLQTPSHLRTPAPAPGPPQSKDLTDQCLPQSSGRFWSIGNGAIREWTISGNSVTDGGVVAESSQYMYSLAFCSVLGPTTFYCDNGPGGITYYDNDDWVYVPLPHPVLNHGGSGAHLYSVDTNNDLYHFDGTTQLMIADPSPGSFVGDIVVREDGNAIVAYAPSGSFYATAFRVYAPDGTLVETYSTSFSFQNSWGAFLLNNIVYIAFGGGNAQYPQKLVPFTLSSTSAQAGTPVPFPQNGMLDLASCTEPGVSGLPEPGNLSPPLLAIVGDDLLRLQRKYGAPLGVITVFDARGRSVYSTFFSTSDEVIEVHDWPAGVYLVQYDQGTVRVVKP